VKVLVVTPTPGQGPGYRSAVRRFHVLPLFVLQRAEGLVGTDGRTPSRRQLQADGNPGLWRGWPGPRSRFDNHGRGEVRSSARPASTSSPAGEQGPRLVQDVPVLVHEPGRISESSMVRSVVSVRSGRGLAQDRGRAKTRPGGCNGRSVGLVSHGACPLRRRST